MRWIVLDHLYLVPGLRFLNGDSSHWRRNADMWSRHPESCEQTPHRAEGGLARIEEFRKVVMLSFLLFVAMSQSSRSRGGGGDTPVIDVPPEKRPLEVSIQNTTRQLFARTSKIE